MSRISQLPPRCPFTARSSKGEEERADLIRFPSLGTILEEQPCWLDDLLADSDVGMPKGGLLRRAMSDSAEITHVLDSLQGEGSGDLGSVNVAKNPSEGGEVGGGFVGSCVYGPNSPRQKSGLSDSEVSALMETIPPSKLQYVTVDYPCRSAVEQSDLKGDFGNTTGELDSEKAARRRSGQRSRVRKLQYIAELERTVEIYQTLGTELAATVSSLFQQRVALSLENKSLRLQLAGLQHEKMIKDGQYQSLKTEAERLRLICGRHRRSKSFTSESGPSATSWQMLDFGNLSLGGNSAAPLRDGSASNNIFI